MILNESLKPGLPDKENSLRPRLHDTQSELKPAWNSNRFEKLFCLHGNLHGDFTVTTSQTIARLLHMCKWYILINENLINAKKCYQW